MSLFYSLRLLSLWCVLFVAMPIVGEGFVAGTLVYTPQGYVPIEELSVGDEVITYDFNTLYKVEPIVHVTRYEIQDYVRITIKDIVINVAADHRFLLPYEYRWEQACNLTTQTCLIGAPLSAQWVDAVETVQQKTFVYSLSLGAPHTYLVSERNILVHNFDPGGIAFLSFKAVAHSSLLAGFLAANPLVAPLAIGVGGATLIGCAASKLVSLIKTSRKNNKNDTSTTTIDSQQSSHANNDVSNNGSSNNPVHEECVRSFFINGAGPLNDTPLPTSHDVIAAEDELPIRSCCPEKENKVEQEYQQDSEGKDWSCGNAGHDHDISEPIPCGLQGQSLPELGSAEVSAGQEVSEDKKEEVKNSEDESKQKDASDNEEKSDDVLIIDELADLSDVLVKIAGRGNSKGRTEPKNHLEKLAMNEVMSNPKGILLEDVKMTDSRWPADEGWQKYAQNVNDKNGNNIEIHYIYSNKLHLYDDFKFKDKDNKK